MRKHGGFHLSGFSIVLLLLVAGALSCSQAAFAGPVTPANSHAVSGISFSFATHLGDSGFGTHDGSGIILPGPQVFKRQLGDLTFGQGSQDDPPAPMPTPEPSTILLLGTGLLALVVIRRVH
jgi:hypothetical protein